jgi:hypothetical protein
MAVTLEKPLEAAVLVYVQHHVSAIFEKISEGTFGWEKLSGCFSTSVRNLPSVFCFMKN